MSFLTLRGLGADDAFEAAAVEARQGVIQLSRLAKLLQQSATDLAQQNIGDAVIHFTDVVAPRMIADALSRRDATVLLKVQLTAAKFYNEVVSPEVRDSLVERFLAFPFVGLLAALPAEQLDAAKEEALEFAEKNVNPLLKKGLGVIQVAGIMGGVFLVAYLVNTVRGVARSNPSPLVRGRRQERHWRTAKAAAKRAGREDDYRYITGIYKRIEKR